MNRYLNKVMIVDGSYMLHRALHTPVLENLTTSSGIKSGGVFGLLRILQSEIKKNPGYFPIFCWDRGLSERRTQIFPEYKANRKRLSADNLIAAGVEGEVDDYLKEYHRQREDVIQILKSLGIPSLLIPGWEGDDLQYLVSCVTKDGIVLSDDKDMIQLVSSEIKIRRAMKDETISWEESDPYYHHPHFTIVKSICGDPSDNIPQVTPGLGWKGADLIASLIDDTEDLDEFYSKLQEVKDSQSKGLKSKIQKLINNWDQFVINYKLINLRFVEPPEGFESMIKDLIVGVAGKSNIMKAYSLIGKYEISTVYPDQIIFQLSASAANLFYKE